MSDSQANSLFAAVDRLADAGQAERALQLVGQHFTDTKRFAELFEILKLQARQQLDLPLVDWNEQQAAATDVQSRLEQALYRACGVVGEMLFRDGQPGLAWKYFQLVGDRPRAQQLLRAVPIDSESLGEIIHVAIDAGVDPEYGLQLTVEHQGLCNGITAYDSQIAFAPRPVRAACARFLLQNLYNELFGVIRREVASAESRAVDELGSLGELIADRPWLFAEGRVHVDTSHLAAVVRMAKLCDDADDIRMAVELCQYGQAIDPQYRLQGEPPLADHFVDHQQFFEALMNRNREQTIEHFRQLGRDQTLAGGQRQAALEIAGWLSWRAGDARAALAISTEHLRGDEGPLGLLPSALEIACHGNLLAELAEYYARHDNLLMYTTARLLQAEGVRR